MHDKEAIAVLVAGYDENGVGQATVVLRDMRGNVTIKQLPVEDTGVRRALTSLASRRGRPILDPDSRELLGYEIERVAVRH